MIEYLDGHIVTESRPMYEAAWILSGIAKTFIGKLLALFVMAEAFEAANGTTYITGPGFGKTGGSRDAHESGAGMSASDQLKPTALSDGSLLRSIPLPSQRS